MNKLFLVAILFSANLSTVTQSAHALSLSIIPSAGSAVVGGNVNADLVISDLGSGGAASTVGAFDINIGFDSSILSLNNVTFGALLGNLSLSEAIAAFDNSTPGTVNLFEVSLLEASASTCVFCQTPYLDSLQPSSFLLATLSFIGTSQGTSTLTPVINAIGDGEGNDLARGLITAAGSVTVGRPVTVPEPSILALLSVGLLGWMFSNRKKLERFA